MSNGPQTPQILIVGAGAMGLGTGYHLQLAGTAITFLVRPARMLEMSRRQVLYSYDDATLKTFADYRLISDAAEISRSSYDYVIVTLDSLTTRNPSTGFCRIQQIPSWRQGQGAGYRAAQGLREGRRTGRPTDVRSKGTPR